MRKGILKNIVIKTSLSTLLIGTCLSGYSHATESNGTGIDNRATLLLESVKQNYLASIRLEALRTKNAIPDRAQINSPAGFWMKRVKTDEINMVTNRYTTELQSRVILGGKVYYTLGESYAWTMQQNPSIRFAKDPLTGKTIDKADAIIYIDADGRALYFESEGTYKKFLALAEQETVYGYTEPEDSH